MSDAISKAIEAIDNAAAFIKTFGHYPLTTESLRQAGEGLQALQSGEPVARVIDDGTPEGSAEWIPFCNRIVPLKTGDLLYATPQPTVNRNDLIELLIATRTQSEGVTADLIIKLLSADKEKAE